MKIVAAIFEKMKMKIFFLMWTTHNFQDRSKMKKYAGDICKGTLDIECGRDWSVSLGATLGDGQIIKNYFSSFRDFSGKSRYCHIIGVHCCGASGSMRACHAAGPGSIPGRDKFPGWGYFGVFPHP